MQRVFILLLALLTVFISYNVTPAPAPAHILHYCDAYAIKYGRDCSTWLPVNASPTPTPAPTDTPAPTPTPTATPNPVPAHIMTWAYDHTGGQGGSATYSQIQQYVDYAEGGYGNTKAVTDCDQSGVGGMCQSVFYSDTSFMYDYSASCPNVPDTQWTNDLTTIGETSFFHLKGFTDSAHRIAGSYTYKCAGTSTAFPVYAVNKSLTAVQNYFNSYFQTNIDNGNWDIQMDDDTKSTETGVGYESAVGGSLCKALTTGFCWQSPTSYIQEFAGTTSTAVDLQAANMQRSYLAAMKRPNGSYRPQIVNSELCAAGCPDNSDGTEIFSGTANPPLGGICEACFNNHGTLQWSRVAPLLNLALKVGNLNKLAIWLDYDPGVTTGGETTATWDAHRLAGIAMIWLEFFPNSTVYWDDAEYISLPNNLTVFPEEMIFPTNPVESMSTSSTDIQVTTGVYVREFAQCYQNAVAIGPCAALLNTTSSAVTVSVSWLTQTYHHQITLVGGDILSGGSVNLTGATFSAGATSLPATSGMLLSQ